MHGSVLSKDSPYATDIFRLVLSYGEGQTADVGIGFTHSDGSLNVDWRDSTFKSDADAGHTTHYENSIRLKRETHNRVKLFNDRGTKFTPAEIIDPDNTVWHSVEKTWVPHRSPDGERGWKNAEDPTDSVVYEPFPPGAGYTEQELERAATLACRDSERDDLEKSVVDRTDYPERGVKRLRRPHLVSSAVNAMSPIEQYKVATEADTLEREWVPYEGPRGGTGWQREDDPEEVRYVEEPPGEVAEGYEQAETLEDLDQEQFVDEVRKEYGRYEAKLANSLTEDTVLKRSYDAGYVKFAAKEVFDQDTYAEFRQLTDLDSDHTAREGAIDVIEAVQQVSSRPSSELAGIMEFYDEHNQSPDLPEVPLKNRDEDDWRTQVPPADEDYSFGSVNTLEAVLYETEDGLMTSRIWRYEGEDDTGAFYTLENGEELHHDEIEAYGPNEKQALRVGSGQRVSEGNFLRFEVGGTPYEGKVDRVVPGNQSRVKAYISTPAGPVTLSSTSKDGLYPLLSSDGDDDVEIIERQRAAPDDYEAAPAGVLRDTEELARDITDSLSTNWQDNVYGNGTEMELRDEMGRYFPRSTVDNFYGNIKAWKSNSGTSLAGEHSAAFKKALDIGSQSRGWNTPDDAYVKMAGVMYEITQSYLKDAHGAGMTLYRGMSHYGFDSLMRAWVENPDARSYELDQMALNNYTPDHTVARQFSTDTAIITAHIPTRKIALAADALAAERFDEEKEMHVMGDNMTVDADDIGFTEHGVQLSQFPDGWTRDEHEIMADIFKEVYANMMPISEESHEAIFQKWAQVLKEDHQGLLRGSDASPEVRELIDTIEADKFVQYEVVEGPQTQLDEFNEEKQDSIPVIDLTDDASVRWSTHRPTGLPDVVTETRWSQYLDRQQQRKERLDKAVYDDWVRYDGPRGGEGWKNPMSGEVRYQEDKPDEEVELPPTAEELAGTVQSLQVPREEYEEGEQYLFGYDDEIHSVVIEDLDPDTFLGPDNAIDVSVPYMDRTGTLTDEPLFPTDEPAAALFEALGYERYETFRESLITDRDESFEDPPRGFESRELNAFRDAGRIKREHYLVYPDGTKQEITAFYDDETLGVETPDGIESLDIPELKRQGAFVHRKTPLEPDELKREEKVAVAVKRGREGPRKLSGVLEANWNQYGGVLDEMTDEELAESLVLSSITLSDDPGITGNTTTSYGGWNAFMGNEVEYQEYRDEGVMTIFSQGPQRHHIAPIISRMSKDSLLSAVDEAVNIIDGRNYPKVRRLLRAAYVYAPEQGVREAIEEQYDRSLYSDGIVGMGDGFNRMLKADSYESFKSAFIHGWSTRADSDTAYFIQQVLDDLGSNKDSRAVKWTRGNAVGDVYVPEEIKRYAQEIYEETQAKLDDEPETLYRGVYGPITAHSNLESWSSEKIMAERFADDDHENSRVMTARVDPEDVFCTWETLGEEWPEEDVKGKKEWMVLGGGLE